MGGVFMKKLTKTIALCLLLAALVWCGTLFADRKNLGENLIRLHVVANSDSEEDQSLKLQIRDAVMTYLQKNMDTAATAKQAKQWLQTHLAELQMVANNVLAQAGSSDSAAVSLQQETFDTRQYDTFSLPAGVYEALRITVGNGEGKNWWCVVFPSLCLSATSEGFEDTAAGAGFPDSLTGALSEDGGYEIRFFFLDWLGKIENFFFGA